MFFCFKSEKPYVLNCLCGALIFYCVLQLDFLKVYRVFSSLNIVIVRAVKTRDEKLKDSVPKKLSCNILWN